MMKNKKEKNNNSEIKDSIKEAIENGVDESSEFYPDRKVRFQHWIKISVFILIFDIIALNFSYFFALFLRFDFHYSQVGAEYIDAAFYYSAVNTIITIAVYYFFRLYNSIWRFVSWVELQRITIAVVVSAVINDIAITLLFTRMPISYYIVGFILQYCFAVLIRFSYRLVRFIESHTEYKPDKSSGDGSYSNVMVIGAGESGKSVVTEIMSSDKINSRVCCLIDDNPNKQGRYINGVKVVGTRHDILASVDKYHIDEIIIAMPSVSRKLVRDIINICKETSCKLRIVPGIYQMINGDVSVSKLRDVNVEDLLGRDQIKVNTEDILGYVKGKIVMVTGGGGSIGSELCRQIARHDPKLLIIFDIYENNAYDIEQELKMKCPKLKFIALIGSVRDEKRVRQIFEKFRPDIVYHAAAHKHVPLMEVSPNESIKNNVLGTYKVAKAAADYGCHRFVLISTDKAVNPTSIMGASKRLCEMVIQMMNRDYKTEFVAVRFGNVLGSSGSVIPLFKKQISNGGPVTVTHPDIVRYFMTIPEAVSLVLQAGAYAKGGEIFVLDMGEPVKIADLAYNLIKLSGYVPNEDIMIEYTGLRPGEKLYEEKLMAEEGLQKTANSLIHIGKPIEFNEDKFMDYLGELKTASENNSEQIIELVKKIIPGYKPERSELEKIRETLDI